MFGFRFGRQKGLPPSPPGQVIPYERRIMAAITPRTINNLVRGAEWAARFNGGGSLPLANAANGPTLRYAGPVTVMAKLSGAGPAYDWVEVVDSPKAGFPVLTGGRSGTGNAYEANGKTGMSGSVVCLKFTPANDWRFQVVRTGIPAPVGCTFCLNVTDLCTSASIVPTSAVLKSGSTVIATASIGNQLMSVTVTAGGSGYSNGWHTLGISGGGGSGAAGEFFVSSGHVSSVSLTANGSGYTSAPTISFLGAGGSGPTGTGTVGDTACFQGIATGTYTLVVTASGHLTYSASLTIGTCNTRSIQMTPATYTLSGTNVAGCPSSALDPTVYQSGISVTGVQGTTSETTTTDASGNFTFTTAWSSASGVVLTFTDPAGRFSPVTYTYTPINICVAQTTNAGSNGAFASSDAASGYACTCLEDCFYPIKTTLHMSESAYGTTGTLTYSGGVWTGTLSIPYAGCSGNDGLPYSCPGGTVTVTVSYSRSGPGGCDWVIQWNETPASPPGAAAEYCPNDAGALLRTTPPNSISTACATALSIVGVFPGDPPGTTCGLGNVFPGGTTITITE